MKIKNLKLKIIFFGSSSYVIPVIEVLQKNFALKLVVTTEKNPTDAVPSYCIKHQIPYLPLKQFNNLTIQQLKNIDAPLVILADFGLIIPKGILSLFPKGIFSIHPSLLPEYRGPTPVQTAILNGEKVTGVSIIKLDEEIDHGPILTQKKEEILPTDTSESLYKRLFKMGADLLPKILPIYLKGDLKLTTQNHRKATFTKPLTRQSGFIDLSSLKIENCKLKIARMIRAYYPWPGVWTKCKMTDDKWKILKFLPDKKLQVEGKKPVSYQDFINGYPEAADAIGRNLKMDL